MASEKQPQCCGTRSGSPSKTKNTNKRKQIKQQFKVAPPKAFEFALTKTKSKNLLTLQSKTKKRHGCRAETA